MQREHLNLVRRPRCDGSWPGARQARPLGVKRLYLEGGPATSGRFLHAGLIDEISLLILPGLDGYSGAPTIFEFAGERDSPPFPVERLKLTSCDVLDGDVVWLRHGLTNASCQKESSWPGPPEAASLRRSSCA